jgi:hypothetical protein
MTDLLFILFIIWDFSKYLSGKRCKYYTLKYNDIIFISLTWPDTAERLQAQREVREDICQIK